VGDVGTAPPEVSLRTLVRARMLRRAYLALLVVFLACGALGLFGVRTGAAQASGGGFDVEVHYAEMSRPGLATPWSVQVRKAGGFDGPVTLAVTQSYLDLFDENGLDPDPAAATSDDERVIWEFDPPESGDTLIISFDARIEPAAQAGRSGVVEVLVDGEPVVSVRFKTNLMP
jgi:hypothetical protein